MDQQTFNSGFTKREFVVTTDDDRYPQDIKFECIKDKCALLDGVEPGQRVTVTFDLRGNEYNDRYYVNLTAWRINPAPEAGGDADAGPGDDDRPPINPDHEPAADDDSGLPF
jgi:hypothetical protein